MREGSVRALITPSRASPSSDFRGHLAAVESAARSVSLAFLFTVRATVASGDPELIASYFDGDATPAAGLIRASFPPLTVTEARDIAHLPTWSANGMVVIGDAAHPVSPMTTQGASLAIEDAAVLAQCLRDVSPVPDALRVFEGLQRERVEEIVRSGASGENPGPPAPGPRPGPRPSPVLDHHIDWEASVRN